MKLPVIEEIVRVHGQAVRRGLRITRKEYAARWAAVQAAMRPKGYDLALSLIHI